ncbi:unnamed protein product [Urochloa humidicola]
MAQQVPRIDLEETSEVITLESEGAKQVTVGSVAPEANEQRNRGALRWTSAMSGFVLRLMCQLIETGVRTDKGFKEMHLNQVAKYLSEFTGMEVTGTQVYNHLRKWRQRLVKVSKLRELSGAQWVENVSMISLEEEHYLGHIKDHPKDAEFLNAPIVNYKEMEIIFGNALATGKYAMGSNEALGSPSLFYDSDVKSEPYDEEKAAKGMEEHAKMFAAVPKEMATGPKEDRKRKRSLLSEEDHAVFSCMTEAVKDVAAAIRETKVEMLNPELYGVVMYTTGFNEEALIVAFSHLADNKAQGDAFVKMTEAHRVLWLRTWLDKHYYL